MTREKQHFNKGFQTREKEKITIILKKKHCVVVASSCVNCILVLCAPLLQHIRLILKPMVNTLYGFPKPRDPCNASILLMIHLVECV